MSDYTPSTDEVRINYIGTHPSLAASPHQVERPGEFERWLESVEAAAEQRGAKAVRERIAQDIEAEAVVVDEHGNRGLWVEDAARIAREGA